MLLLLLSISIRAANVKEIRDILKHVETNHNPLLKGDNDRSWGILQIQQIAIDDVNKKYGTDYTHQDAFDINCAEEIFELYIEMWTAKLEKRENREASESDIVRIWNGGPRGYKKASTLGYLKKYQQYKKQLSMSQTKCIVRGEMGVVTATYTHTMDVYMFKARKHLTGVSRKVIRILPKDKPKGDPGQLKLVV